MKGYDEIINELHTRYNFNGRIHSAGMFYVVLSTKDEHRRSLHRLQKSI